MMLSTGQHTLNSQQINNDSFKYCILVKLTDSSAKAIDEYIKNKNNTSKKPSIIFQKDKGEIYFPTYSNNQTEGSQFKKLQFGLSSVKESSQSASFECISYLNSKLVTIGNIEQKLSIHANVEESFKETKEKLNNVAEEEKKNALIEIKPSGAPIGINRNLPNRDNRKIISPNVSSQTNNNKIQSNIPKSEISIRERLIHLLAIKPESKPMLFLQLKKDNSLTEKEKESLDSLIHSVSTLNNSNKNYELNNDILINEVKEDWPYFTEAQQTSVKKNIAKAKLINNLGGSNNISIQSSNYSKQTNQYSSLASFNQTNKYNSSAFSSIQPPPFNASKQNLNFSNLDNSMNSNEISNQITKNKSPIKTESIHIRNKMSPKIAKHAKAIKDTEGDSPDSDDLLNDSDISISMNKRPIEKENQTLTPSYKLIKTVDPQEDLNENEELLKKYPKIRTKKEAEKYKNEFNDLHIEYLESHNYLEPISGLFQSYKSEIESISDTKSKEYEEKKQSIYKEYTEKLNDLEFIKNKEKYEKLHRKLNYLQELIREYDSNNQT